MTQYNERKARKDISQNRDSSDGHAHTAQVMRRHAARLKAMGDEVAAAQFEVIAAGHEAKV